MPSIFHTLFKFSHQSAQEPQATSTPKIFKTRKRALTLPLPPGPKKKQTTLEQNQSPLFGKLPVEIRLQIWREYYSGMVFKLTMDGTLRQLQPFVQSNGASRSCVFSLLLCCRRTYSEAIDFLYSSNAFMFHEPECITKLPQLLLPQRINAIQDLHFQWLLRDPPTDTRSTNRDWREWCEVWQKIACMEGLKKLHVELMIAVLHRFNWARYEARLLKVVAPVTRPELFLLTLPWSSSSQSLDGLPCQILRASNA